MELRNCENCGKKYLCGFQASLTVGCRNWTHETQYFSDYQQDVLRTIPQKGDKNILAGAALGLVCEAGEAGDVIKKYLFQGHELNADHLMEELGDTFFYMTVIMQVMGLTLTDVITANQKKRAERYPNGFSIDNSINNRG